MLAVPPTAEAPPKLIAPPELSTTVLPLVVEPPALVTPPLPGVPPLPLSFPLPQLEQAASAATKATIKVPTGTAGCLLICIAHVVDRHRSVTEETYRRKPIPLHMVGLDGVAGRHTLASVWTDLAPPDNDTTLERPRLDALPDGCINLSKGGLPRHV